MLRFCYMRHFDLLLFYGKCLIVTLNVVDAVLQRMELTKYEKNILPNGDIFFLILFYVHGYVFYGFRVTYATGPNTLTRKGFYSDLTSETPSSMIDK